MYLPSYLKTLNLIGVYSVAVFHVKHFHLSPLKGPVCVTNENGKLHTLLGTWEEEKEVHCPFLSLCYSPLNDLRVR